MPRALSPFRSVFAASAAVVLLAACGGGSANDSAGSTSSSAATTGAAGDFCAQAADLDKRVDSALAAAGGDDPSVPDAFRQLATELRAIDPPQEIAADWETQASGLEKMADALADIDITDPGSLAKLDEIDGNLSTASDNVANYLKDQCGIDTSG